MAQKQATRTHQAITLKGSTALVTEFFEYSVNSILYQRGVYPSDDFRAVKKYGLGLLVTADEELKEYIKTILAQVSEWLLTSSITRLVLAITSTDTQETLERWQFDIKPDDSGSSTVILDPSSASSKTSAPLSSSTAPTAGSVPTLASGPASKTSTTTTTTTTGKNGSGGQNGKRKEKTEKEVQKEIMEIMKQITSTTTFLPILEEPCSFTLLAYTDDSPDIAIPSTWHDADPHLIDRGKVEQVRLRSFSTNVHSLEAMVAYRVGE